MILQWDFHIDLSVLVHHRLIIFTTILNAKSCTHTLYEDSNAASAVNVL